MIIHIYQQKQNWSKFIVYFFLYLYNFLEFCRMNMFVIIVRKIVIILCIFLSCVWTKDFRIFWESNTHYWWCNNFLSNEEIFRNLASFQNYQIWSPSPSIQNQFHLSCVSDRNTCTRIHLITWNITVMITQWGQQAFVKSHLNFCVQYDFKHLVPCYLGGRSQSTLTRRGM